MSLKERLVRQLQSAREMSERLLADFSTPEQWTSQVYPGANHALWFAGHMGSADNFFISLVEPSSVVKRPVMDEKFGMGSQPTNQPQDYPAIDEVLSFMRERRATLLKILDRLTDEDLAKPMPAGSPDFLSDVGSIFEMAVWHEGMHSGQLTVSRRALGKPPLF